MRKCRRVDFKARHRGSLLTPAIDARFRRLFEISAEISLADR